MPTYPYECLSCRKEFDIIKSVSHLDDPEACPTCGGSETKRFISRTYFYGASDWDSSFNYGLGCVTKSRSHREKIIKERGLIEVGNEDCEKISSSMDRDLEKARDDRFEKSFERAEHELKKELVKSR